MTCSSCQNDSTLMFVTWQGSVALGRTLPRSPHPPPPPPHSSPSPELLFLPNCRQEKRSCSSWLQIQPPSCPQLLRALAGDGQTHSGGIHWTWARSTLWRSAFSSLNAAVASPLTITLSNRCPHWFSMVSARSIMFSKSSSCHQNTPAGLNCSFSSFFSWFSTFILVLDCKRTWKARKQTENLLATMWRALNACSTLTAADLRPGPLKGWLRACCGAEHTPAGLGRRCVTSLV